MRKRTALAGVVVAGVVVAGVASLAQATTPAPTGRIAYSRYRFVNSPLRREIWVSNVDGNGARQVSHAPPNYLDSSPSWSSSGRRLVFTRCPADEDGACAVWAVNADGTGQRRLSAACTDPTASSCVGDDGAVYSPDG